MTRVQEAAVTSNTQRRVPWWLGLIRLVVALALVLPIPYAGLTLLAPVPSTEPVVQTVQTVAGPPASAVGGDVEGSGFSIPGLEGASMQFGRTDPMPMASVIKVVTVLAVLEAHPLEGADRGPLIPITDVDYQFFIDAASDEAPAAYLRAGDQVTQRDLVEWALVASSANAIWTLGNWAFGSIEATHSAVDDWMARHGLVETVAADLVGLSLATTSTVADLLRLGELAMADPVVAASVRLTSVNMPGTGLTPNTNRMLGALGVDGIKTGSLYVWGRNLLFSATAEVGGTQYRVVGAIMGAENLDELYGTVEQMLASIWPNIHEVEVLPARTPVASYATPWGAQTQAVTEDAVSAWVWGEGQASVSVDVQPIQTAIATQDVGSVTVTVNGQDQVVDAVLTTSLDGPDAWWRLTHPLEIEPFGLFR